MRKMIGLLGGLCQHTNKVMGLKNLATRLVFRHPRIELYHASLVHS